MHGINGSHIIDVYPVDAGGRVYDIRPSKPAAPSPQSPGADTVQLSHTKQIDSHNEQTLTYQHLKPNTQKSLNKPVSERIIEPQTTAPQPGKAALTARAEAIFNRIADSEQPGNVNLYI